MISSSFSRRAVGAAIPAAILAALALTACSDSVSTRPAAPGAALLSSTTTPGTGPWATVTQGETGPSSLYAVYVPNAWNGDVLYVAHGFRDVADPVGLQDQDNLYALRDAFGAAGYAVAYSSYDENGFAVKDGVQRMHQLRGLAMAALPRVPKRSLLVGYSLGGAIDLKLAEQYPSQYDGAFLVCGMVGGSLTQTQYVAHTRALFDYFYPGKLPGSMFSIPPGTIYSPQQIGAIIAADQGAGMFAIASTKQTPMPFVPLGSITDPSSLAFQSLVGSLTYTLAWHARGIANVMDLVHGHTPFDNASTQYVLGTPVIDPAIVGPLIQQANAGVDRFAADPSAWNYLEHNFTPTGKLSIPVMTVHSAFDFGVPAFHEDSLYAAAQRAGSLDMLLQRRRFDPTEFGHCNMAPDAVLQQFGDFVQWVNTGVKPAP